MTTSLFTMDHSDFIVCSFTGDNPIGLKRFKLVYVLYIPEGEEVELVTDSTLPWLTLFWWLQFPDVQPLS